MVSIEFDKESVGSLLELVDDSVVEGILVLLEPSGDVVGDSTGVMSDGEVTFLESRLGWLGFQEAVGLAQMVGFQFCDEGFIRSLGEHRLFLKDGEHTHGL
jgi:hypothetical protein